MPENRKRILDMLSEGKINVDEAERLLSLVDEPVSSYTAPSDSGPDQGRVGSPKYLRVVVEPVGENGSDVH